MTVAIFSITVISVILLSVSFALVKYNSAYTKSLSEIKTLEAKLEAKCHEAAGKDERIAALSKQVDAEAEENRTLKLKLDDSQKTVTALEVELATLRTRVSVTEEERQQRDKAVGDHFKNLATEIFRVQSQQFKEHSEQRLQEILSPLKSDLDSFKKTVSQAYDIESKERFSLQREIKNLIELNRNIGREAQDLARALKGNAKIQGDWGEMILERLLEMSGLQNGIHFKTQVSEDTTGAKLKSDDGGYLRPDVVVYYPDGRCVVIDSKVSLTAYVDYITADEGSDAAREAGARHIASVQSHIKELETKRYQDLVGDKKLDFVMMFIPNEGAYLAMMKIAPDIWEDAYRKRVLLTSPTHLISVLKMLEQLWKQDAVNKNVMEIARLSGTMVDKFVGFIKDLENVEKHLDQSREAYAAARKKLAEGHGNAIITAKKIVALGAKATKAAELDRAADDMLMP